MNLPKNNLPLKGLKVVDLSTLFAGPVISQILGDFGADVIKIEHPKGDALRSVGEMKDGVPLWWKLVNRNKKCITLNLKHLKGKEILKQLISNADVLVENFRTGTLESWGLGWDVLSALNPRLVMVRVTGFGQTGPYARRPGFGTLVESMSGFAHVTGEADGPPTLPPFGLADGVAGYYGAFSVMFALWDRDVNNSGKGQFIDLAIHEPLFALLGYQSTLYDQLGIIQKRSGNKSRLSVPRNTYKTSDDQWVAISSAAPSIAMRVLQLTGGDAVANDPRFQTAEGRREHLDEIDSIVANWMSRYTRKEVLDAFEKVEAAIAPVYDIAQIFQDPQFQARQDIISVPDSELGTIKMQNVFPFLSRTPGRVTHAGPKLGEHNQDIYSRLLGVSEGELDELKEEGVI